VLATVHNRSGPSSTPQHSTGPRMVHSIVGGQARTKQTARYRYVSHKGTQLNPSDEEDNEDNEDEGDEENEMSASSQSLEKEEGQVNSALEPKEEGQVDLPLESKKE
jgi:hypothetical protein